MHTHAHLSCSHPWRTAMHVYIIARYRQQNKNSHVQTHMCVHTHTCCIMHARLLACFYEYTCTRSHRHARTHMYICAHMHTHTSLPIDGGGRGDEESRRGGSCLQTSGGRGAYEERHGGGSTEGMGTHTHACMQTCIRTFIRSFIHRYTHTYIAYVHHMHP